MYRRRRFCGRLSVYVFDTRLGALSLCRLRDRQGEPESLILAQNERWRHA